MQTQLVLVANAADGTVSSFSLSGAGLVPLATSGVATKGLPLAVDAGRNLVFAGTGEPNGIAVTRLDRSSGELKVLSQVPASGPSAYLSLTSDGRLLFSASYHAGVGEVFRVAADGTLTAAPVGARVAHQNLHSVIVSADDRFAYFVSLREDLIAQYGVGSDGTLTPIDPPTAPAPTGSGPRHIVFNRDQTAAYVITEFSGELIRYNRDPQTGVLSQAQVVRFVPEESDLRRSRYEAKPRDEHLIWGSDLHFSPEGSRIYCAERTNATITAVAIGADGTIGEVLATSPVVGQPRGFAVSDSGDLVVASENEGKVALYRPDDSGALTELDVHEVGDRANWVEIL